MVFVTTVFHEGLPGHQMEGGLALSNKDLPLIRKAGGFAGYAEGWALYAEQLADEIGMYDDDPLGRIGYLQFQLFRANRCVVDTGIHHMGWSREQGIQHFIDSNGSKPSFAAREVERYCVNPGQACSYKLGHTVWIHSRAKSEESARRPLRHQGLPRSRIGLRTRAAGRAERCDRQVHRGDEEGLNTSRIKLPCHPRLSARLRAKERGPGGPIKTGIRCSTWVPFPSLRSAGDDRGVWVQPENIAAARRLRAMACRRDSGDKNKTSTTSDSRCCLSFPS